MEILIIVVLIISCLSLLLALIILILFIKNKKQAGNNSVNEEDIKNNIDSNLKDLKIQLKDELYNMNKELNNKVDIQNKNLNEIKENNAKAINENNIQVLKVINDQLSEIRNTVDGKLKEGFKSNSDNLEKVNLALGKITKAQENIDKLNNEVVNLNSVLNNTQARGRFGEIALESILREVFGDTHETYSTQYVIQENNVRPDAVIFLPEPDKLLCIDSKFPFVDYQNIILNNENNKENISNFKKELKTQIDKIAKSYIIKNQTCSYAIMFIPNDSILGFLQSNDDLYESIIEYARKKYVILCSPSTLQAILSNVLTLKLNYEISNNVNSIIKEVNNLKSLSKTLSERWDGLSKNIDALKNKKDEVSRSVDKVVDKTNNIVEYAVSKNIIDEKDIVNDD